MAQLLLLCIYNVKARFTCDAARPGFLLPDRQLRTRRPAESRAAASRGGFTLAEVLVALFLLAFVMAGVYRTMTMSARLRTTAHRHYLAVIVANNRIERAKNVGFGELPFLAEDGVRVNDQGVPDAEGQFRRTTEVRMEHGGNPRLAWMRVTVELPSARRGADRVSESVTSLLTEYVEP